MHYVLVTMSSFLCNVTCWLTFKPGATCSSRNVLMHPAAATVKTMRNLSEIYHPLTRPLMGIPLAGSLEGKWAPPDQEWLTEYDQEPEALTWTPQISIPSSTHGLLKQRPHLPLRTKSHCTCAGVRHHWTNLRSPGHFLVRGNSIRQVALISGLITD